MSERGDVVTLPERLSVGHSLLVVVLGCLEQTAGTVQPGFTYSKQVGSY
eukprot:COSAG01_NODE_58202_length_307_cov_1.216346_1_plen_48_part_01